MPYVMVPVPAEHEQTFTKALMSHVLRTSMTAWTPESARELLGELAGASRDLVRRVARFAVAREPAKLEEIAAQMGLAPPEVMAMADRINEQAADRGLPELVLFDPLPAPGETTPRNEFAISRPIAVVISEVGFADDA